MVRKMLTLMVAVIVVIIAIDAAFLAVALVRGSALAKQSKAFQKDLTAARKRLLVVGDSTGVGTGAERPRDSVAGRLAEILPDVEIVNLARDGARTAELLDQLDKASGTPFDAILIQTGGNDILRITSLRRLRASTRALLQAAKKRAGCVVMMSTGDVGAAPAFPWPVDAFYSLRTRKVRGLFLELASRAGIDYVDLYDPGADNPFHANPDMHYARDGLHPSAAGYGLWFEKLKTDSSVVAALSGS